VGNFNNEGIILFAIARGWGEMSVTEKPIGKQAFAGNEKWFGGLPVDKIIIQVV
jgi:hypothetical protein